MLAQIISPTRAGALACFIMAACVAMIVPPNSARAADPILIGFSAPLTGDAAGSGQEALDGAKLAVAEINAKGGILGRPVQLVEGDDRCDPKDAALVAQKFIAQKIAAAASHYCSGAALAALPILREAGVLYVDWGAVSSKIPGSGYDRLFITIYNGAQPGVYAADIAVKTLGMKNSPWSMTAPPPMPNSPPRSRNTPRSWGPRSCCPAISRRATRIFRPSSRR